MDGSLILYMQCSAMNNTAIAAVYLRIELHILIETKPFQPDSACMRPNFSRAKTPRVPVCARNWIPAIYRHSYAIGLWISDLRVTGSRAKHN